jgi:hypothetical protein
MVYWQIILRMVLEVTFLIFVKSHVILVFRIFFVKLFLQQLVFFSQLVDQTVKLLDFLLFLP